MLVVDGFGVKYVGEKYARHTRNKIKRCYKLGEDWTGALHFRIKLDCYYRKQTSDISIPGYIETALDKFQYISPERFLNAPHKWNLPHYGVKVQMVPHFNHREIGRASCG